MHLPGIACCVLAAIAPLLWLPRLPALSTLVVIIVAGCVAGRCRDRRLRYFALWLLLLAWGILTAYEAVWPIQHLPGRVLQAQVRLTGSDNITTHRGVIERLNGKRLWPGAGITLYGEYLPQRACAGQLWEMTLKVRPVHGQLNEGDSIPSATRLPHISLSLVASPGRMYLMPAVVCGRSIWRRLRQPLKPRAGDRFYWHSVWVSEGCWMRRSKRLCVRPAPRI